MQALARRYRWLGLKAGRDGFVMRIAFIIVLVVMGLFAGALLRTEAVLACPARTTPHFPSSNFGVFAAYETLDAASKADKVHALTAYFFNNCRGIRRWIDRV